MVSSHISIVLDNSFLFFADIDISIFLFFIVVFYVLAMCALSPAPCKDWALIYNLSRAFHVQDGVESGVDSF